MNIGIDHGYYAIKTRHFSFLAGIAVYSHEPYTLQNTLEYGVPNASTKQRNRFARMSGCLLPMLRWNVCWAEVHRWSRAM